MKNSIKYVRRKPKGLSEDCKRQQVDPIFALAYFRLTSLDGFPWAATAHAFSNQYLVRKRLRLA